MADQDTGNEVQTTTPIQELCATKRDVDAWFADERNWHQLRRCASHLGPDADDTVQRAYFEAVIGIDGLRDRDRLGAWIRGIHRNILLSHWRWVRRNGVLPIDQDWSGQPGECASDEDLMVTLRIRESLPPIQRGVLDGFILGETAHETAQRLGLTRNQVYYARDRMREALSPRLSLIWACVPIRAWFAGAIGKLGFAKLVLGLIVITGLSIAVTAEVTEPDTGPESEPVLPRLWREDWRGSWLWWEAISKLDEPEVAEREREPQPYPAAGTVPAFVEKPKPDRPSKETSLKLVGDIRELQKAGKHREALEKSKRLTHPEFRKTRAELQIGSHCALGEREAASKLAETYSLPMPNPCD